MLTARAFLVADLGDGLLWLLLFTPLLVAAGYWLGVLFAEVSATAVLDNHSGGVTVTRVGAVGTGQYEVDFGRAINTCTAVATLGLSGSGSPVAGEVYVADRSGNQEAVFVDTNTSAGAAADRAFRLVVVC